MRDDYEPQYADDAIVIGYRIDAAAVVRRLFVGVGALVVIGWVTAGNWPPAILSALATYATWKATDPNEVQL